MLGSVWLVRWYFNPDLGELVESRLAHAVGKHVGKGAGATHARHVNNCAFCFNKVRHTLGRQLHDRAHVRRHHTIIVLHFHRFDAAILHYTGVVHLECARDLR